jgi:YVTN family beta-propeller protein
MAHLVRPSISLLVLAVWMAATLLVSGTIPVAGSIASAPNHHQEGKGPGFVKQSLTDVKREATYRRTLASSGSIPVGSVPVAITYDVSNENLYVANLESNNITVASASNGSTVGSIALSELSTYGWPTAEVYDGGADYVYVAGFWVGACTGCSGPWTAAVNGSTNQIVATNTSMEGIDVSDYFDCLGYNPVSTEVYVCDTVGKLIVMNGTTDTIIGSVRVASLPSSVAVDESNGDAYVTNWGSDNVSVIQSATNIVLDSITVGSEPDAMAYDSSDGYLYVANNESNNVTVIDGASNAVIGSIPVGCSPDAVAIDSENGDVFVANACSNNVTVINSATDAAVGAVAVGSDPDAIAFDPANEQVFVANAGSNNVTVFPARLVTYSVTFTESGMPTAAGGGVALNGGDLTPFGPGGALTFSGLANGSYNYTVSAGAGYQLMTTTPSSPLTVDGANVTVSVTFEAVYTLTFTETGMLPAAGGGVALTTDREAQLTHYFGQGGILTFSGLGNGTYSFTTFPGTGYQQVSSTLSSPVAVNGTGATVVVEFEAVYSVTFTQSGIPNGTTWTVQVTLTSTPRMADASGAAGANWSVSSTGPTALLLLPNGTFSYLITAPGYQTTTGTFSVSGQTQPVPVTVSPNSSGQPGWVYAIIGVVIAGVVVGVVIGLMRHRRPPSISPPPPTPRV